MQGWTHYLLTDVRVAAVTVLSAVSTGTAEILGWLQDGGFATMAAGLLSLVLAYSHYKRINIELDQEKDNKSMREAELIKMQAEAELVKMQADRERMEIASRLESGLPIRRKVDKEVLNEIS